MAAISVIDWLQENAPGFRDLTGDERNAIMHFSLLWSLFEGGALNTHGNAKLISVVVERWAKRLAIRMDKEHGKTRK